MKRYLLDSNIAIAILINDPRVQQATHDKEQIYFSVITQCEVLSGLRDNEHLKVERMFGSGRVLEVSSPIAKLAGSIRRSQRDKGRNVKTPDALIMATAIHGDLTLISRDQDMQFAQDEYGLPVMTL